MFHTPLTPHMFLWLVPLILIDVILKAIGLWRAGRNNHLGWFIAIFIINSIGILPAVYLIFFDTKRLAKHKK